MRVLKGERTLSLFLVLTMVLSLFVTFPVFAEESAVDTSNYTVSVFKDGTGDGEDGIMTLDKWSVVLPTGHPDGAVTVDTDATSATYGQLMFNMLYGAMTYTYEANSTANAIDNYVAEVTGSIWGTWQTKTYVKLKTVGSTTYYLACWYYGSGSSMQTRYAITTRVLDDYYGSATQNGAILSNVYSVLTSTAKESAKWKFVVVGDKIEVYRNEELIISYQNEALKGGTASFGFGGKRAGSNGNTNAMYISDVSIFKEYIDTSIEYTQQNLDDNFVRLLINDQTFTKGVERTFKVQIPADGNYAVFLRKVETANNTFKAYLKQGATSHQLEYGNSANAAYGYNYVRLGAIANKSSAGVALTQGEWTLSIIASAADITVPYIDIRSTNIEIDGSKQAIYPSDFNSVTSNVGTADYVNGVMQSTNSRVSGYDYYADYTNSNLASTWLYGRGIRIQTGRTATYKLNVTKAGTYVINMNIRFRTRAAATSDASTTVTATGNSSTAFTHTYPANTGSGVNTEVLSKRYYVALAEGANEITVNPTSSFADMYLDAITIEPVEPYIEDGFSRVLLADKAFEAGTAREFEVEIKQKGDYAVFLQKAETENTNFTVTFTKDGETKTLCDGTSASDSYGYNYVRIGGESGQNSTSVPLTKGKWTMSVKALTAMNVSYIDVRTTTIPLDGSKQAIYPSDYNTAVIDGADFINGHINKEEYARVSDYDYYADYTNSNLADTFAYGRGIKVGSGKSVTYKLNVAEEEGYKIKLNGKFLNSSEIAAGTVAKASIIVDGNDGIYAEYTYDADTAAGTETEWSAEYDVTLARGDNVLTFTADDTVDAPILGLTVEYYNPKKENAVNLVKDNVANYMTAAKEAYVTDAYAKYTNSVIYDYLDSSAKLDIPKPVSLSWDAISGAESYTLLVSKTQDFSSDVLAFEGITETSYDVPNLYVDTIYYWKVQAAGQETETGMFYTAKTARFINVEGVRNFRDIGGWNGLNQGMAYRGSAMDPYESLSSYEGVIAITDAGKKVLRDDLGIKTDLDFRNTLTESPLGSDINFIKLPNGNYTSAYTGTTRYKEILQVFADIDNYPIYFHCSGGADRTGTVAFVVEALCGVAEEDLAIDFELTSLCSCFGTRPRHDTADYFYASTVAKMKEFEGNTLQEKAEDYALNLLGLTRAEVSNIQSILAGNAVVFESSATVTAGRNTKLPLKNLNGHTVSEVTVNDKNMDFSLSGNILTVRATETGKGIITFDDGNILTFDAEEFSGCVTQTADTGFTRLVMQDSEFTAGATCKFPVSIAEDGEYTVFLNKEDTNNNNFKVTFEQNDTVVTLTEGGEASNGYAYNYVRAGAHNGVSPGTAALTAGDWIMCITPAADTEITYIDIRSAILPITGATQAIYPSDFNTYTDVVSAYGDVNGQINEFLEKTSGYSYIGDYEDADLTVHFAGDRGIYFDAGKTVNYKLNVKQAGTYKLTLNHSFNLAEAAGTDTEAVLTVSAGDNEAQTKTYTYPAGKAGKTEAETTAITVPLTVGVHTLSFTSDVAGSYLYHLTAEQVYNDKVVTADNNLTRIETDALARTIVAGATRSFNFSVPVDGDYNFFGQIGTGAMTMEVTLENLDTQEVTTVYNGSLPADNNKISRLRRLGMGQTPAVALTANTRYRLYLTPSIDITVPFIDVINLNLPISGKTAISAQYYSATNITDAQINNNDQTTKQTTPASGYTLVGNFLSSDLADQSSTSVYSNFSKFYAITSFISNTHRMSYTLDVQKSGVYQIQVSAGVYSPTNTLEEGSEIMDISVGDVTGSPQYTGTTVTSVKRLTGPTVYLTEGKHTLTLSNPAGGKAGFYIHQILVTPMADAGVQIKDDKAYVSAYLDGTYTGTVMIALYSSDNELVGAEVLNLTDNDYVSAEITLKGTPVSAKVFVWEDLDSITPLTQNLEVTNESSNWKVGS